MQEISSWTRCASALSLGLLVFSVALPAHAQRLTTSERAQLVRSGRVGAPAIDRVESEGRAPVLIVFRVPEAGPGGGERFRHPRHRHALASRGDALLGRFGAGEFELQRRFGAVNAVAGRVDARGLVRLANDPDVLRVDLDSGGSAHATEAVPLVGLDALQTAGLSGDGIQVAILDSGVDLSHTDLSDAVIAQECFCSDSGAGCCPNGNTTQSGAGSAQDDNGHGTNVAGIVTSNGTTAPLGGAPGAEIVAVKVLDHNANFCCSSDIVAGLDWIAVNRPDVDVVNMSLGTSVLFSGNCDTATSFTMSLAIAIDTLRANGVLSIVSAGNDGSGSLMSAPACVAGAISVGAVWDANVGSQTAHTCTDATTQADQVTCWSNSNASTDVFAPGGRLTSTALGGGSSTFRGTSQAAPLVTACVAALLENDPSLTADDLETVLETSSVLVTDTTNSLDFPRLACTASAPVPGLLPHATALLASGLAGAGAWAIGRSRRRGQPCNAFS